MKKLLLIPLFLLMTGCMSQVPAGHVGVKVYLLGGSKGVDHEVLGVGRYYIGYNEQLFLFPTFQQNYVWTASEHEGSKEDEAIEFGANQGVDVHANVGVSFHIDTEKVADVFQKYRKGVDEIRDIPLRNAVRNAFNKRGSAYTVEQLYSTDKAKLLAEVLKDTRDQFAPIGIVVDDLSFVGNFKLPEAVTNSLNAKIQATQDADRYANEVAGAKSKKEKAIIESEAIAISNSKKAASLSPSLIEWEKIQKWDGHLPTVQGGGTPFINLTTK